MRIKIRVIGLLVMLTVLLSPMGALAETRTSFITEIEFAEILLEQSNIDTTDCVIETIDTDSGKAVLLTKVTSDGDTSKEVIIPYIETESGIDNSFTVSRQWSPQWNPANPGTYVHENNAVLSDFTVNLKVFFEKTTTSNHFRLYWTDVKWTKTNPNSSAYVSKLYIGTTVIADKYSYPGLSLLQKNASAEVTRTVNDPYSGRTYDSRILMHTDSNYVYKLASFMEHTSHGWVEFTYYDSKGRQRVDGMHMDAMRY